MPRLAEIAMTQAIAGDPVLSSLTVATDGQTALFDLLARGGRYRHAEIDGTAGFTWDEAADIVISVSGTPRTRIQVKMLDYESRDEYARLKDALSLRLAELGWVDLPVDDEEVRQLRLDIAAAQNDPIPERAARARVAAEVLIIIDKVFKRS